MAELVLIRHGQSKWNLEGRFTGWVDVPISKNGMEEARKAGCLIKDFEFDLAFTSVLSRAVNTLVLVCSEMESDPTPVFKSAVTEVSRRQNYKSTGKELEVFMDPALNERNYGDLQGRYKEKLKDEVGEEQVQLWRRGFKEKPPGETGESLEDTCKRTVPYFNTEILPKLKEGKNVLVVAHGNSLRALSMELDKISEEEIPYYEIATGVPIVYEISKKGEVVSKKILE